jgi:hypothetical protein
MMELQHANADKCEKRDITLGSWCMYGVGACFHLMSRPMTWSFNNSVKYNFDVVSRLPFSHHIEIHSFANCF